MKNDNGTNRGLSRILKRLSDLKNNPARENLRDITDDMIELLLPKNGRLEPTAGFHMPASCDFFATAARLFGKHARDAARAAAFDKDPYLPQGVVAALRLLGSGASEDDFPSLATALVDAAASGLKYPDAYAAVREALFPAARTCARYGGSEYSRKRFEQYAADCETLLCSDIEKDLDYDARKALKFALVRKVPQWGDSVLEASYNSASVSKTDAASFSTQYLLFAETYPDAAFAVYERSELVFKEKKNVLEGPLGKGKYGPAVLESTARTASAKDLETLLETENVGKILKIIAERTREKDLLHTGNFRNEPLGSERAEAILALLLLTGCPSFFTEEERRRLVTLACARSTTALSSAANSIAEFPDGISNFIRYVATEVDFLEDISGETKNALLDGIFEKTSFEEREILFYKLGFVESDDPPECYKRHLEEKELKIAAEEISI